MSDSFKKLSDVFFNEEAFENLRRTIKQSEIISDFENIFPDLKLIARAVKLDKGVLFLSVENSVWRSELRLRQKIMIEKINKHFNEQIVKSVKFLA